MIPVDRREHFRRICIDTMAELCVKVAEEQARGMFRGPAAFMLNMHWTVFEDLADTEGSV